MAEETEKVKGPVGELVFKDLITSDDFDIELFDGQRHFRLSEIVEAIAMGLSGQSMAIENDVGRMRRNIITCVAQTMASHKDFNKFTGKAIMTISAIVTDHMLAKAYVLAENIRRNNGL